MKLCIICISHISHIIKLDPLYKSIAPLLQGRSILFATVWVKAQIKDNICDVTRTYFQYFRSESSYSLQKLLSKVCINEYNLDKD